MIDLLEEISDIESRSDDIEDVSNAIEKLYSHYYDDDD